MTVNRILSAERLRELFDYQPETGRLICRERNHASVVAGSVAGKLDAKGYRRLIVDRREYRAHRLIWLYVHGCWPEGEIDHMNGLRDDNRIKNLRDVSTQANAENRSRAQRYSKTGLLGVRATRGGRYQGQISVRGCTHYLGVFETPELAHAAYLRAKRVLHPHAEAAFLARASGQAPITKEPVHG